METSQRGSTGLGSVAREYNGLIAIFQIELEHLNCWKQPPEDGCTSNSLSTTLPFSWLQFLCECSHKKIWEVLVKEHFSISELVILGSRPSTWLFRFKPRLIQPLLPPGAGNWPAPCLTWATFYKVLLFVIHTHHKQIVDEFTLGAIWDSSILWQTLR